MHLPVILLCFFITTVCHSTSHNNELSGIISSANQKTFDVVLFFTSDLKASNNFLTKADIPNFNTSSSYKTNTYFEIVTVFRKYQLRNGEAHIAYRINITDPKGKDYFSGPEMNFSVKNLKSNDSLLIDPTQFLKVKFTPDELKGKYKVYIFAVDLVSKSKFGTETFLEHK